MNKLIIPLIVIMFISALVFTSSAQETLLAKDSKVKEEVVTVTSLKDTMIKYNWCKKNSDYNVKYDAKLGGDIYKFKDKVNCEQFNKVVMP